MNIQAAQKIKYGRSAWVAIVPTVQVLYSVLFHSVLFSSMGSEDQKLVSTGIDHKISFIYTKSLELVFHAIALCPSLIKCTSKFLRLI
jgi:hypothetical protein